MKEIFTVIRRWLQHNPPPLALAGGYVVVLVVGIADNLSGREVSWSLFYLIPVAYVSWFGTRVGGLGVAATSAIIWLLARWPPSAIVFYNFLAELVIYASVSLLVSKLKEEKEEKAAQSKVDELTGLANRRSFLQTVRAEVDRAARYSRPLTLVHIDLDRFALANEKLTRSGGDAMMQLVAATIKRNTRSSDFVARLGGDAYGLLLVECDLDGAQRTLEKLQSEIRELMLNRGLQITMTAGAIHINGVAGNVEELLRETDIMLGRAKRTGRNIVRLRRFPYEPETETETEQQA